MGHTYLRCEEVTGTGGWPVSRGAVTCIQSMGEMGRCKRPLLQVVMRVCGTPHFTPLLNGH